MLRSRSHICSDQRGWLFCLDDDETDAKEEGAPLNVGHPWLVFYSLLLGKCLDGIHGQLDLSIYDGIDHVHFEEMMLIMSCRIVSTLR